MLPFWAWLRAMRKEFMAANDRQTIHARARNLGESLRKTRSEESTIYFFDAQKLPTKALRLGVRFVGLLV